MSFKFSRFLYLSSHFILGSFFLILGLFSVVLPWSLFLQEEAIRFMIENGLTLTLFGSGIILIGISIIVQASLHARHRTVQIETGKYAITLDEDFIEQTLETYWKETFPQTEIPFFITIHKRSIQIEADLPSEMENEQQVFLDKIKGDFNHLFGSILGYPHEVNVVTRFK